MSWTSGSVIFDGPNKRIIAVNGTSKLRVKEDLYSDWKEWIVQTGSNSKYLPAFEVIGGQPTPEGSGKFAGSIFFLLNGWKLRPDERSHELTIDGNLFTNDGTPIVSAVTGTHTVTVLINNSNLAQGIETPALSPAQQNYLKELWQINGLDVNYPLSVSDTLRKVADVIQNITMINNTASMQRV